METLGPQRPYTKAVELPPRIVCAAMLMEDGCIITGIRHFSPDMRIVLGRIYGRGYHLKVKEQGFINIFGSFLNREDAWTVAGLNGQIRRDVSEPGSLYSENLY